MFLSPAELALHHLSHGTSLPPQRQTNETYYCARAPETTAFVDHLTPLFGENMLLHYDGAIPPIDRLTELWPVKKMHTLLLRAGFDDCACRC